jgi:hypothetical protein
MTRNLFLGADLSPAYRALAAADGLARLPAAVSAIFNPGEPPGLVQRSDFATRAVALADEIAAAEPDVIGLQEAAVWSAGEEVAADHLALLEAELERRGLRYRRVGGRGVRERPLGVRPSGGGGGPCPYRFLTMLEPIAPPHALDNVCTCVSPSSHRIRGRTPGA